MPAKVTSMYVSQPCIVAAVGGEDTVILKVFVLPCFPDIHYFHCLRIVELLKGTEASTKNIFGRYSSQRMKASVGDGGNTQLEASSPGGQSLSGLAEDPVETPT